MTQTAYVNGQFLALKDASIPIMDRGFLFGDSIYEVITFFNRQLFQVDSHLKRLHQSLSSIYIECDIFDDLKAILQQLIEANPLSEGAVYLQVTRGVYPTRSHDIPDVIKPSVVAFIMERTKTEGKTLSVTTLDDIRWQRCDIKSTSLLANVLMQHQAQKDGFDTAILVKDGYANEGPISNLFVVKDNTLFSPPNDKTSLAGITQRMVILLSKQIPISFKSQRISLDMLYAADEVWLTSSTKGVCAVTQIDGKPIANGVAGPLYQQMHALLSEMKQQL